MEIEFNSRHLERCYDDFSAAVRAWGQPVAKRYIDRIETIRTAATFWELYNYRALRCHPLHGADAGKFAITLIGHYRLIVIRGDAPDHLIIHEVTIHYDD